MSALNDGTLSINELGVDSLQLSPTVDQLDDASNVLIFFKINPDV